MQAILPFVAEDAKEPPKILTCDLSLLKHHSVLFKTAPTEEDDALYKCQQSFETPQAVQVVLDMMVLLAFQELKKEQDAIQLLEQPVLDHPANGLFPPLAGLLQKQQDFETLVNTLRIVAPDGWNCRFLYSHVVKAVAGRLQAANTKQNKQALLEKIKLNAQKHLVYSKPPVLEPAEEKDRAPPLRSSGASSSKKRKTPEEALQEFCKAMGVEADASEPGKKPKLSAMDEFLFSLK